MIKGCLLAGTAVLGLMAAPASADELRDALAEGGRIVTGLFNKSVSRLAIGRKTGGAVSFLPLGEMGIPAIPDFAAPKRWSF